MKSPNLLACLHPSHADPGATAAAPTLGNHGNHPERFARQLERHFGGNLATLLAHMEWCPADEQKAVIDGSEALRDFLGIRNPNRLGKMFLSSRSSSSRIPDHEAPPALALAATRSGSDGRVMRALARLGEILSQHPPGSRAVPAYQQRVEAALRRLSRDFHALRTPAAQEKALDLIQRHLPSLDPGPRADIISLARLQAGRPGIDHHIQARLHQVIAPEGRTATDMASPARAGDRRGKGMLTAMLKQSAGHSIDPAGSSSDNASLSPNKKRFMEQKTRGASVHLSITEITKLAKAYSQEIGSRIHVSGSVIPITAEQKKAWCAEQEMILDRMLSARDSSVRMLYRYFPDVRHHPALLEALPHMATMSTHHFHPEAIPQERKAKLTEIIDANTGGIRDALLACMRKERSALPVACEQLGHGERTGEKELAALAKAVANNATGAAEGYIFASSAETNSSLGVYPVPRQGHVESYVVSSTGAVIDVIPYGQGNFNRPKLPGQYSPDMLHFLPEVGHPVLPQAGTAECGTFGLSYLKQYLKDNARQLNENTLLVDLTMDRVPIHFHLPSPQVLKYSQSNLYADIVRAFVESEQDSVAITHGKMSVTVKTLQGCLNAGATVSRPDGKEIPGGIAEFRKKWLDLCDASEAKRQQMRAKDQGFDRNLYAMYASQRLQKKAASLPE